MARQNNDAREILCNMVTEKASEKRSALVSELDGLDASLDSDYKKRLAVARKKLAGIIDHASEEIAKVLAAHGLQWGDRRYGSGVYNIENILDSSSGKLNPDLEDYIKPVKEAVPRRESLKQDIADLDAKVHKAKQEILLRAALGMKYDEVVAIVNSFQF